jgi:hypothetical protein
LRQDNPDEPQEKGPGWSYDSKGRGFRVERNRTVYQNQTDRDEVLDETYRLSPSITLLLEVGGAIKGLPAMVTASVTSLAEMFWHDASSFPLNQSTNERLENWEVKNFGRMLEPSAHQMLAFEVSRREQGKRDRGTLACYSSMAEQKRFEAAARETKHITGSLERLEAICALAGVKVEGIKSMPDARLPYRDDME